MNTDDKRLIEDYAHRGDQRGGVTGKVDAQGAHSHASSLVGAASSCGVSCIAP